MKKIIYVVIIFICLFMVVGCEKNNITKSNINKKENKQNNKTNTINKSLMSLDEFKNLNKENIKSASKTSLTEAGSETNTYTDITEIDSIYDYINSIKIGEETNKACDDNTTIYKFELKDNTSISVEIECDWIVINNKRYLIVK